MNSNLRIGTLDLSVSGGFLRRGRLRNEYYETVSDPASFLAEIGRSGTRIDLFTFLQGAADRTPKFTYHVEKDPIAVLPITTYDAWWKSLKDKTRNMVRKATKSGVEI